MALNLATIVERIMYRGLETFGRYYSCYRGKVIRVDDPEGQDRIRVFVPKVARSTLPAWAYPKNQFSGQGYGTHWLPKPGDTVWVEFQMGDPRFPIWSHGHFGTGEKPEEFEKSLLYGVKTPSGHLVYIDDENNTIAIKHKAGFQIEITEDEIKLNGGNTGPLIKLTNLLESINRLENRMITHQHISPAGNTVHDPTTNPYWNITSESDLADPKVLH